MRSDPRQTHNLAGQRPDVVAELDHLLTEWVHRQAGRPGHPGDPMPKVVETGPFKYVPYDYWLDYLREQGRGHAAERIAARLRSWPDWEG